jgi:enoyl-CoA hydratase/carnithine racemase
MKLEYQVSDGIGVVVLSDPPSNALRRPDFADRAALVAFLATDDLRGVILRGAGHHFSAGADLGELERLAAEGGFEEGGEFAQQLEEGKALLSAIAFAPVPVVAMIRGSCLGAGLEIALSAHFRVASENAVLGFPESGLGLMPGLGGTASATEVIPRRVAADLMMTGKLLSAAEALELGLVDRVVPTRDLEAAARRFLDELLARRSPRVVHAIMRAIHNARQLPRDAALREEGKLFLEIARATAHLEGGGGERK